MLVEAHKDPATGQMFENPVALAEFQEKQRKAAEAVARITVIRKRLGALRSVVRECSRTPAEVPGLVHAVYQKVLGLLQELAELRGAKRTAAQRRQKLDVVSVGAQHFKLVPEEGNYEPHSGLYLEFTLRIQLTREPEYRLFCDEMQDLQLETVLAGFSASGRSHRVDDADGTFHMCADMRIALKNLPEMHPRVVHLAAMKDVQLHHEDAVDKARWAACEAHPELATLRVELEAANAAVRAAVAAREALEQRVRHVRAALGVVVEQRMPFERQSEVARAEEGFAEILASRQWENAPHYL